jgi:hypothetical protein
MKLFEFSGADGQQGNNSDPALRAIVANEMRLETPIFEFAEFYQMGGSADTPLKASTQTGGNERAINSDFGGNATAPSLDAIALKIIGDKIMTDKAYERRFGPNGAGIESERLRQLKAFSRSFARHFVNLLINGAISATQFNGLKALCTSTKLVSIQDGADGDVVVLGNSDNAKRSQQKFLKALDLLIDTVNPSCLLMNSDAKSYIEAIARDFVSLTTIDNVTSLVLTRYKGVPVINARRAKDNATQVITSAETKGESDDCTSIYAVKFGEKIDTTLATNVGLAVDNYGLVGSQYVTNVEMDIDMAILSAYAAQRMEGIRLL